MADYCTLPLDVVVTILVRLSVISLLRLRSVCKSWRSLIDSSHFINQHILYWDANSNGGLIVIPHFSLQKEWALLSGHQFEMRINIDPLTYFSLERDPPYNKGVWTILNSCNGIVCLTELGWYAVILRVALWNPATRQLACLPEPPSKFTDLARENLGVPTDRIIKHLGFGYAEKADDYKVVRVIEFMSPGEAPSAFHHQAQIYNLSTNCWRNIDVSLPSGFRISISKIYCNGRYFWELYELSRGWTSILSFDFTDEAFEIILLPDVLFSKDLCLTTMRDLIACIDSKYTELSRDGQFDIWVMTKYGVKESWTKLHTIKLNGPILRPEGFSKNGEILFLSNDADTGVELAFCDLKTQQIKSLKLWHVQVAIYKESLVSIKKAM